MSLWSITLNIWVGSKVQIELPPSNYTCSRGSLFSLAGVFSVCPVAAISVNTLNYWRQQLCRWHILCRSSRAWSSICSPNAPGGETFKDMIYIPEGHLKSNYRTFPKSLVKELLGNKVRKMSLLHTSKPNIKTFDPLKYMFICHCIQFHETVRFIWDTAVNKQWFIIVWIIFCQRPERKFIVLDK